jgi:3-methyladenine DNA glycosylase AlkC
MANEKRKGARSTKEIPAVIMKQLNAGEIETANLVEWLAVDQRLLLKNLMNQLDRTGYLKVALNAIDELKKPTVNTINEAIGISLLQQSLAAKDTEFFTLLFKHSADLVRCWATYMVGRNNGLTLEEKLHQIQSFAADTHFGVREIAWMAVRGSISNQIDQSIGILSGWTTHEDANVRRFASESTRPRGVWCEHIESLKKDPKPALIILDPLKSDPSRYVQDSVGNWLNDASKTQPEFVAALCSKWQHQHPTKATLYIIKKAMRTIEK